MGMYDSVYIECPNCKKQVEFQSKSGKCYLKEYPIHSVPRDVLKGILGDKRKCERCGKIIEIEKPNRIDGSKYVKI